MRFGFYDNRDNRNNGLIVNSMLSVLLFKKNSVMSVLYVSSFDQPVRLY